MSDDQHWFALAKDQDDLLSTLLLSQEEKPIELHPYQQEAYGHPERFVLLRREHYNRLTDLAGQAYVARYSPQQSPPEEKWYVCRYGHGCKAQYKNSPSNRTRHEKQAHNYHHKENGHAS
jgi:hypothetical protein